MMKIIEANNKSYFEFKQESSIRFTPIVIKDNNYYQLFKPVSCRDKMQDVPLFLKNGRALNIKHNGFKFGTKEENELLKYQGDTLLLGLTFNNIKERESVINNLGLLTSFEKELGVQETRVIFSNITECCNLILELDLFWAKSPLTISYVTFFLRVMSYSFIVKKNSFEELFQEIEERWSERDDYEDRIYKGEEETFIPALLCPLFNFRYVLRNIDSILGDDPLTYFNDRDFLKKYNTLIDNDETFDDKISLNYNFKLIDYEINIDLYLSDLHGCSGFKTVYKHLKSISPLFILNKERFIHKYIAEINRIRLRGNYYYFNLSMLSLLDNLTLLYQREGESNNAKT